MVFVCWCKECPFADQCSPQAWKRAAVWGYTRGEAEERLVKHLMSSGLHGFAKEDAESVAGVADFEDGDWEEDTPAQEEPRQKKLKREFYGQRAQGSAGEGSSGSASQGGTVAVAKSEAGAAATYGRGNITVRREVLCSAVDALSRAVTASKNAARRGPERCM